MADDDTTTEAEATTPTRLDRLEATQEAQGETLSRIEQMIGKLVPGSHAEAQERTEARLDRGTTLAEQVKAELAKAKADEAAAQAAEDEKSERQQIREQLAQLREKPPAPPRNPLKGFATIGWGDGR